MSTPDAELARAFRPALLGDLFTALPAALSLHARTDLPPGTALRVALRLTSPLPPATGQSRTLPPPGKRWLVQPKSCLGQISRFLLSSLPRLTVRVDDSNSAFVRIARRVGDVSGRAQRFVWGE